MSKQEVQDLSEEFYEYADSNKLDKFYAKFSGASSTISKDTYTQLIQLSYNYFCHVDKDDPVPSCQNPQVDGAQSSAAYTLFGITQKAAAESVGRAVIAEGAIAACVMQPNDVHMTAACLEKVKSNKTLLHKFQDNLPKLGISETYFGKKITAACRKI